MPGNLAVKPWKYAAIYTFINVDMSYAIEMTFRRSHS